MERVNSHHILREAHYTPPSPPHMPERPTPTTSLLSSSSSLLSAVLADQADSLLLESTNSAESMPVADLEIPSWQPDSDADSCPICHTIFTLFYRRHHCRICGRVVCGSCSLSYIPYPPFTYVLGPHQPAPEPAGTLLRTCDDCIREPDQHTEPESSYSSFPEQPSPSRLPSLFSKPSTRLLPPQSQSSSSDSVIASSSVSPTNAHIKPSRLSSAFRLGFGAHTRQPSPQLLAPSRSTKSSTVERTGPSRRRHQNEVVHQGRQTFRLMRRDSPERQFEDEDEDDDDEDSCPICGLKLSTLKTEQDREDHVNSCLTTATFSGSPDQHRRRNRMVVYKLPESHAGKECVICFEEFKEGDLVARLECLCVYHRKCIKAWFEKKGVGECPVHAVSV
ncbi:FYVE zinc finger-domain-containing protein, partial [Lipomyces arxii]|uniref:FYVE zinc finger-domain-containing protein n=1 Tax=Lipomyces arxii TaxID=56418 RepID=UPI0034CFBC34